MGKRPDVVLFTRKSESRSANEVMKAKRGSDTFCSSPNLGRGSKQFCWHKETLHALLRDRCAAESLIGQPYRKLFAGSGVITVPNLVDIGSVLCELLVYINRHGGGGISMR